MSIGHDESFGDRLRLLRTAARLSQEELAERAGLSRNAISALERGERHSPYPSTVRALVAALGLSTGDSTSLMAAVPPRAGSTGRLHGELVAGEADTVRPSPPRRADGGFAVARARPVGRARELEAIERHLAGEGPATLLLAGEPGIGKTRMLDEAAHVAALRGWRVLRGGCHRRGGQEPYAPLLGALEGYLHTQPPARLNADLEGCSWLARLLPELSEGLLADVPLAALSPQHERRLTFRALAHFLSNVTGAAGTILVLDDLQWAGPDALDLLLRLVAEEKSPGTPDLRLIAAYRESDVWPPDALSSFLADLAHAGLVTQRTLLPLTGSDARLLVEALLRDENPGPGAELGPRNVEHVLQRAGGVPFFLVSCVHGLRAEASGDDQGAIPWDIAQSVRQRVGALPEAARAVLGVAAVTGRRVPYAVVRDVSIHSEAVVEQALDAAARAQLLVEADGGTYQFAHDVLREVIEADLGAARRIALHRRVASVLEGEPGLSSPDTLAYHYICSGDHDKAAWHLEEAGDRARTQYAHAAAEHSYRAAIGRLDGLGDVAATARVQEKLGLELRIAGRYEAALAALDPAARTYRVLGDHEGVARALAQMARTHAAQGAIDEGTALLQPLLAPSAASVDSHASRGLMDVYLAFAWLAVMRGAYDDSLHAAQRAIELALLTGDDRSLAQAYGAQGGALHFLGRLAEALEAHEKAIPLAASTGDLDCLCSALDVVSHVSMLQGRLAAGLQTIDRAVDVAEQLDDPAAVAFETFHRGYILLYAGEWAGARRDCEQALGWLQQVRLSGKVPYFHLGLGSLHYVEGGWQAAEQRLEECVTQAARIRDVQPLCLAQVCLADIAVRQGHPGAAHARLARLLEQTTLPPVRVPLIAVGMAAALLALGRVADAKQRLQPAIAALRAQEMRLYLVDALRVEALLAAACKQWAEVEQSLAEGLELAGSLPYPYAEGRLLHVAALVDQARGNSQRAREQLERAHSVFRRLGAQADVALVEQALANNGLPQDEAFFRA